MDKNPQLAQYSLPGIMHYLQSEWTRNERDRIQYESEKAEMKAVIARLTSENAELKKKVAILESKKGGVGTANSSSSSVVPPNVQTNNDLEALIKAKQYLKQRMHEVLYVLRTPESQEASTQEESLLGLRDNQPFGIERVRPSISKTTGSLIPNNEGSKPILPLRKEVNESSVVKNDDVFVGRENSFDVETDNETILGDDDNDDGGRVDDLKEDKLDDELPSKNDGEQAYLEPILTLSSHFAQVSNIAIEGNNLLTASTDGTINLWDYSLILSELPNKSNHYKPMKTFHHDGKVKILKWINKDLFIACSEDSILRIWNKNEVVQKLVLKDISHNLKNLDVLDLPSQKSLLVINDDDGVKFWELTKGFKVEQIKGTNFELKSKVQTVFAVKGTQGYKVYCLIGNCVSEIDQKGKQTVLTLKDLDFTDEEVTLFKVFEGELWAFITLDRSIIYNNKTKKIIFEENESSSHVSNLNIIKNKLYLFYENGMIKIYETSRAGISKDEYNYKLKTHFNHYASGFNVDWKSLKDDEKDMLKSFKNYGEVSQDGRYVFSGGADCSVLCFKVE